MAKPETPAAQNFSCVATGGRAITGVTPRAMTLTLSPWWLLLAAVPILWLGEAVVRRASVLARFNIPVPVVGGLLVAAIVLLLGATGLVAITWQTKVTAGWWTWLVTPDPQWMARPAKNLNLPLLVGFFTCVGLLAPLRLLRTGGRALVVLLGAIYYFGYDRWFCRSNSRYFYLGFWHQHALVAVDKHRSFDS